MDSLRRGFKQEWFYCFNMIFEQPLSDHAKLVYIYLCRCAGEKASSFPGKKTIARACSIGETSVYYATKELVAFGLLSKEAQYRPSGGQTSNLYTLYDQPQNQAN